MHQARCSVSGASVKGDRKMLTLIKREIEDHIAYFLGAAILSSTLVVLSIWAAYSYKDEPPVYSVGLSIPVIVILVIGFPAMGASQMHTDRTRKVSAFLSALPVTRGRILVARIITGILAILMVLVPLTITAMFLWQLFVPPIPIIYPLIYPCPIFDMFVTALLMVFACYCLGLLTGWTSSRVTPTLAGLGLIFVLIPLIAVKGFGLHTTVILVLFIIASLIRIWQKFMSTAL
jgi:hypothetical protein